MSQKEDAHFVYLHQVFCRRLRDDARGYFGERLAAVMLQRSLVSVCLGANGDSSAGADPGDKNNSVCSYVGCPATLTLHACIHTHIHVHTSVWVWLPMQGREQLRYLSHSWVVLTSA